MQTLFAIQQATQQARARLSDKTISTRVENGRIQVVRVTYPNGRDSVVSPVSKWMLVADVFDYLNKL